MTTKKSVLSLAVLALGLGAAMGLGPQADERRYRIVRSKTTAKRTKTPSMRKAREKNKAARKSRVRNKRGA